MEQHQFRYDRMVHSDSQTPYVGIIFKNEAGIPFAAVLSVEDAARLAKDLPEPTRIAGTFSH